MIDAQAVAEIIATYQKYGWILRRVLLSTASNKAFDKVRQTIFGDAVINVSEFDAAWFSRPPIKGSVAWELRYLGEMPYALLESVDESDPEFENILRQTEERLLESVARNKTA